MRVYDSSVAAWLTLKSTISATGILIAREWSQRMPQHHDPHDDITTTLSRIEIPPVVPATSEELERGRRLLEEAKRIREEIGPVGFSAVDLIRQARDEIDADDQ